MGNIKENYELMFTEYPDLVDVVLSFKQNNKWKTEYEKMAKDDKVECRGDNIYWL